MLVSVLLDMCSKAGIDFFTGVPDSLLKGLCNELYDRYGTENDIHTVAHNEGGAIALCAAHYLATGKAGLCYMQNSGIGNAVNPIASLMDPEVYSIPCMLVIGYPDDQTYIGRRIAAVFFRTSAGNEQWENSRVYRKERHLSFRM